jgi:hypothetical protein
MRLIGGEVGYVNIADHVGVGPDRGGPWGSAQASWDRLN